VSSRTLALQIELLANWGGVHIRTIERIRLWLARPNLTIFFWSTNLDCKRCDHWRIYPCHVSDLSCLRAP
jgi:hypothetical protein